MPGAKPSALTFPLLTWPHWPPPEADLPDYHPCPRTTRHRAGSTASPPAAASSPLGNRQLLAAEIVGGRRVTIRIEDTTLMFFDPDIRELLRIRPNPPSWDQARNSAAPAPLAHHPAPPWNQSPCSAEPPTVASSGRRTENRLGRAHAYREVTVHVAEQHHHPTTADTEPSAEPPPTPSATAKPKPPNTGRVVRKWFEMSSPASSETRQSQRKQTGNV